MFLFILGTFADDDVNRPICSCPIGQVVVTYTMYATATQLPVYRDPSDPLYNPDGNETLPDLTDSDLPDPTIVYYCVPYEVPDGFIPDLVCDTPHDHRGNYGPHPLVPVCVPSFEQFLLSATNEQLEAGLCFPDRLLMDSDTVIADSAVMRQPDVPLDGIPDPEYGDVRNDRLEPVIQVDRAFGRTNVKYSLGCQSGYYVCVNWMQIGQDLWRQTDLEQLKDGKAREAYMQTIHGNKKKSLKERPVLSLPSQTLVLSSTVNVYYNTTVHVTMTEITSLSTPIVYVTAVPTITRYETWVYPKRHTVTMTSIVTNSIVSESRDFGDSNPQPVDTSQSKANVHYRENDQEESDASDSLDTDSSDDHVVSSTDSDSNNTTNNSHNNDNHNESDTDSNADSDPSTDETSEEIHQNENDKEKTSDVSDFQSDTSDEETNASDNSNSNDQGITFDNSNNESNSLSSVDNKESESDDDHLPDSDDSYEIGMIN